MSGINTAENVIIRDFLIYMETIKGKSEKTASEYFLDLRMFFRFMKVQRKLTSEEFNKIDIDDIDIKFIESITLSDVYEFLSYTAKKRPKHQNSPYSEIGLTSASRARKISTLRTFFKYLTDKKNLLKINPVANLDLPSTKKQLPKYLSLDDSITLLDAVEGEYKERDYLILVLFLNCGLRVSELVSINISDIYDGKVRVLGKGNKERILFLNEACISAVQAYLPLRKTPKAEHAKALFISRNGNRINVQTVKWLVKKYINLAGLESEKYSAHKLRHTAATLMYRNGVDIRTLQTVLGHKSVDTTMIYTHIDSTEMEQAANLNPLSKVKKSKKDAT